MKVDLSGKAALVTAASKGIGFAVARELRAAGAKVCICARSEAGVRRAVDELGGEAEGLVIGASGDLGDGHFLRELFAFTASNLGGVDILINNSGGPPAGPTLTISDDQWATALNQNLLSAIRLSLLVLPGMKVKGWGRIVHLTSMTAKEPDINMALSNVTRSGVAAFSKTLAREFGPFGITSNTVLTGSCMTSRLESLLAQEISETGESMQDAIARIANTIPVGYIATPEQFAQFVLFLASNEGGYLNGTATPLDGGLSRGTF